MTALSPREARLAFALLKLQQRRLAAALKRFEPFIDQEPGDKNTARLGEARLGKVAKTEPVEKPVVADRDAFTKHVAALWSTEVEQVEQVRPAFERKLLGEMQARGCAVDENGEVVPGIRFETSTPQQRFYPEDGAEDLLTVIDAEDLPTVDGVDWRQLLPVRPVAGES
ncbi:hypothetical protein [Actinomadura decatromicini]|uniref:Uncharacterized protein n=1 Tax=Actinomadura decatromicini TaxID=2604572 RepID=A0A5D3FAV7_9ACTN|nr:hypothetical protein [Actinomadura decatromicini]TYK45219.1 hypothetical protein FXF68_31575 [Actinomadura decatromicini]